MHEAEKKNVLDQVGLAGMMVASEMALFPAVLAAGEQKHVPPRALGVADRFSPT